MAQSNWKSFLFLVIGATIVVSAWNAAAQEAALQLWSSGPATGTIEANAPGISCEAICSVDVTPGATVTLTATPAPGNRFDGWAGDCSGLGTMCTLLMDGNKLAVASFVSASNPLTAVHHFLPGSDGQTPVYGDLLDQGGSLYGMTKGGGAANAGVIFRELRDGGGHVVVHHFLGGPSDGAAPYGSLAASDGVLYGMTSGGGASGDGTLFSIDPDGSGFTLLHSFAGGASDGASPYGSLTVSGGVLYGMTLGGGASDLGTIFRINQDGSGFTLLHSFAGGAADGASPYGSLVASGGVLYGMTSGGGPSGSGAGTAFSINTDGSGFALLHSFGDYPTDGAAPLGSLVASAGVLYGMTSGGGANGCWFFAPQAYPVFSGCGTIFTLNTDGSGYALLHSFSNSESEGQRPSGSLVVSGGVLYGVTGWGGVGYYGTIFRINPGGDGFALMHSFAFPGNASDGANPFGSLVASGGVLYGMTEGGQGGTVFRINQDGSDFAFLHSFAIGASGGDAPDGFLLGFGGAFYGMTSQGGIGTCRAAGVVVGCGTIFRVKPDGSAFTLLHPFAGAPSDGAAPYGSLTEFGGVLYGMTSAGGARNNGTVFKINPDGSGFTLLHSFGTAPSDATTPFGSLVAFGGVLYGMTPFGGANGDGTIFCINPDGSGFRSLHSFSDGIGTAAVGAYYPFGSLVASGGVLYGVTRRSSVGSAGTIFKINPDGSGFALLHSFGSDGSDGETPLGSLVASDGVLYGMTEWGRQGGTIFSIKQNGSDFALLHSFAGGAFDGSEPFGSLVGSGGSLYGMTSQGGSGACPTSKASYGCGTIFRINQDGSDFTLIQSFTGADCVGNSLFPAPLPQPYDSALTVLDGDLYGTANAGGIKGGGVLFRLEQAVGPRVRRRLLRE